VRHSILNRVGLAFIVSSLATVALTGCGASTAQPGDTQSTEAKAASNKSPADSPDGTGAGMAAIKQAADADRYLFLFFSKTNDDDQTLAMRQVFDKAMEKVADRAQSIAVNITDASEKAIVAKFSLNRAPMPLVLAIAPNGAITGGFPTKFDEEKLLNAIATPGTQKVMKQLQDGKLVFVCAQNDKTKSNDAAMAGVRDFKADVRFASATEIVMLDPTDSAEASFLGDLKIDPKTEDAVTVFLVPPGSAIAEYKGATDKAVLVSTLQKASAGSCGPGGCGPGGCK
jgi:hypothetical protein